MATDSIGTTPGLPLPVKSVVNAGQTIYFDSNSIKGSGTPSDPFRVESTSLFPIVLQGLVEIDLTGKTMNPGDDIIFEIKAGRYHSVAGIYTSAIFEDDTRQENPNKLWIRLYATDEARAGDYMRNYSTVIEGAIMGLCVECFGFFNTTTHQIGGNPINSVGSERPDFMKGYDGNIFNHMNGVNVSFQGFSLPVNSSIQSAAVINGTTYKQDSIIAAQHSLEETYVSVKNIGTKKIKKLTFFYETLCTFCTPVSK